MINYVAQTCAGAWRRHAPALIPKLCRDHASGKEVRIRAQKPLVIVGGGNPEIAGSSADEAVAACVGGEAMRRRRIKDAVRIAREAENEQGVA